MKSEIIELEKEIAEMKKRLKELKKSEPHKQVENYEFLGKEGTVISLLELFEDKDELIVIQNMGTSCAHCTMWADGFKGVYEYLTQKAPFVLATPDSPEVQAAIALERNWPFPMVSTKNTTFKEDLNFVIEGHLYPGASIFKKDANGEIYLVANDFFDPGDDYCSPWHFFDLLPSGSNGFNPKAVNGQPSSS